MNRRKSCVKNMWCAVRGIHPVDKNLLFLMLVLLLQSTASMFLPGDASQITRDIDVIVRTSAAAIFGYFLSASFIRSTSGQVTGSSAPHILETGADTSAAGLRARIGFTPEEPAPESGGTQTPSAGSSGAGCLQVAIAAFIGLFCLITLLVLRNATQLGLLSADSDAVAAVVTQFRDFISGCVGFLIGSPTHPSDQAS